MALLCLPSALNPFCRPSICISPCNDHIALASSSSSLYIFMNSDKKLSLKTKCIPHSKSLSCMAFHPTLPDVLVTGGAPKSRVIHWSIEENSLVRKNILSLQRRPSAMVWLSEEDLVIGDEHGNIYRWTMQDDKLNKFNPASLSDKNNDEVQCLSTANKQRLILSIGYKSGLVCVCHVDTEKNQLNSLHKFVPESSTSICCSIQFAHMDSPLERSTLLYISYAHGCIKVCDYTNGKIISQLVLTKQSKTNNLTDPRCKTYYPLVWLDSNTLLTGNLDGHLIKVDVQHSSHMEKSQLNLVPPVSGGKPIFSLAMKDHTRLFVYSYSRKLCIYDLPSASLMDYVVTIPGSVNVIQACPLQTSCIALGMDTANIGILDLSAGFTSNLSFLWQSIAADVCRLAWHPIREGRLAYSTRHGHVGLYDTLTGRSRVVYDWTYTQPGSPTAVLWGPLVPETVENPALAVLYTVGNGNFHRWDSPEKNCKPTDLTFQVQESNSRIITVAFSDDHKYLSIVCLDGFIWLRSCPSMTAQHNFPTYAQPTILLYHPRYLLSSIDASEKQYWVAINDQHKIKLINTLDSKSPIIGELDGHTGQVESLAWSTNFDYLLASGSEDKTIRLWNIETKSALKIYTGHYDAVTAILFSSTDPNFILSGSRDQSLHIWHCDQHTQPADRPIPALIIDDDDDDDVSISSAHARKKHKPRPNRAEREKKRAEKAMTVATNGQPESTQGSSSNPIMSQFNLIIQRLLKSNEIQFPSASSSSSGVPTLPDKIALLEKIKELESEIPKNFVFHLLYWSGCKSTLQDALSSPSQISISRLFFWMAILNDNIEQQALFNYTLNEIKNHHQDYILEFISMMVKMQRMEEILDFLIQEGHFECSLMLKILSGMEKHVEEPFPISTVDDEL